MNKENPKLIIGFLTYGDVTAKYLPYFLDSLKKQSWQDFKVIVFDNTNHEYNKNCRYLKDNYPEIKIIWHGENLGFAKANNILIQKAVELDADYYLAINPDMILEPDALEKMIERMDNDSDLVSVSPKILKWDFVNKKKTNIIDSCGIVLKSGLRFVDLGQSKEDNGGFNNKNILGPSGCAGLYRISALEKIKFKQEYFDELMFMYKEDVDLAYRLFLAGCKSSLVSSAVIYHDRTASAGGDSDIEIAKNRKNKSKQVKQWAFLNQQIIFKKYFSLQNVFNKINVIIYQTKILVYVIFFERYLLTELKKFTLMLSEIKEKKEQIKKSIF